jgi:hypothetical protein
MPVTERRLHLFRGKRQRGTAAPPPPKEFALHCVLADICRRWINPHWKFSHLPMGEHRDKATAGKLHRMGILKMKAIAEHFEALASRPFRSPGMT